jgi:hypothetical protein
VKVFLRRIVDDFPLLEVQRHDDLMDEFGWTRGLHSYQFHYNWLTGNASTMW